MIRKLEPKDAALMLEWMHDKEINRAFRYPFAEATKESVLAFINNSYNEQNKHFAIVNEQDEYLGTVSLKNISEQNSSAEYAVVMRKKAQGTGVAMKATQEVVRYAFDELKLHKIYLNVLEINEKAKRFYQKCGFEFEGTQKDAIILNGKFESLSWYGIINDKE